MFLLAVRAMIVVAAIDILGLLYMNFTDDVAEGDGDIHCWKFLLLDFYWDSGSTKYALEALYL